MAGDECRVCGSTATAGLIDVGDVPIQCTGLHNDPATARAAPSGTMRLIVCANCASVTNAAFDPELVAYDGDYENSQLFSPSFRVFAAELAERLVDDHGLHGKPVVEVGSGKGEFLGLLAEQGTGAATGYDPTYGGEVDHLDPSMGIRLIRAMFNDTTVLAQPALVCARHVLEHVADPIDMLTSIRRAVRSDPSCVLYVEVPNASFTFTPAGLWDIIYQHCTYFSSASLEWVATAAGYDPIHLNAVFGGQFLALDARPSIQSPTRPAQEDVEATVDSLASFAATHHRILDRWRDRLDAWAAEGDRVALWGAGAKGVTFLNLVGQQVDLVVDLNPRKHGRFLPGTGHQVVAPAELGRARPDVLIIVNGAYEGEIRAELGRLDLGPEVVVV